MVHAFDVIEGCDEPEKTAANDAYKFREKIKLAIALQYVQHDKLEGITRDIKLGNSSYQDQHQTT